MKYGTDGEEEQQAMLNAEWLNAEVKDEVDVTNRHCLILI